MALDPRFEAAVRFVDAGDVAVLQALLMADPTLAHARAPEGEAPYEGYFARATLLHHVAGNPIRGKMPANVLEVVATLLEAGAEVDARCGADADGRATTLGLVASSAQAAIEGHAAGLIDALVEAGADVDAGGGANLWTALYHTVEFRGQRSVAKLLRQRGARVDLAFAAALGELETVEAFFSAGPEGGALSQEAYALFRPKGDRLDNPDREAVLAEAITWASLTGQSEAVVLLRDLGAPIDRLTPVAGQRVSPLHAAAWAGWEETAAVLLHLGADCNLRDPHHYATPAGWALHCKRPEVAKRLLADPGRLDLTTAIEFGFVARAAELWDAATDPNAAFGPAAPGALLRTAAVRGDAATVAFLLERGADPSLTNAEGRTALDHALAAGHDEVVRLLRAH